MTGTTQVALLIAGVGVAGTVGGVLLTSYLQRRTDRRAAHEPAVAAARLIKREIEQAVVTAETGLEDGVEAVSVATSAWDQHQAAIAGRLDQGELLVIERFYAVARTGVPTMIVMVGKQLALPAIHWLAEGKEHKVSERRMHTSLAPRNMDLPCECGHIFGHHGWRAVRRRVRIRHRHARYIDRGFECHRCSCPKFRGVGDLDYA
jgi:hypothetical protein